MVHSPYLGYFKEDQTDGNLNSVWTPDGDWGETPVKAEQKT